MQMLREANRLFFFLTLVIFWEFIRIDKKLWNLKKSQILKSTTQNSERKQRQMNLYEFKTVLVYIAKSLLNVSFQQACLVK